MNEIDNSNLSYTSRDYESILTDLLNTIPLLTKEWTAREESDPGIVLVKLMAMVGDMLSYNLDKQALELFPESVTQRKNAYQIYNLLGYKMHWYKSARYNVTLISTSMPNGNFTLPRYSRFVARSNDGEEIYYTNLTDVEYESGVSSKTIELVQGIPKIPAYTARDVINGQWWDNYGYNLSSEDFSEDNKYYLNDSNVEEDTIVLCDDIGQWVLVEDVDLVIDPNKSFYGNRYYDFRIDEYDRPYIRLCASWKMDNNQPSYFKLFYLVSKGKSGQISTGPDILTPLDTKGTIDKVNIINKTSSGYDPETPYEAWINSRNWVNTHNTLITCDDFTKAVRRINGVANAVALDWMTDVQLNTDTKSMKNYEVRVYVIPDEDYIERNMGPTTDRNEVIKIIYQNINNYLMSNKILHLLHHIYWDPKYDPGSTQVDPAPPNVIKHYKWTVQGILYYKTPLSKHESDEIINLVNNTLRLRFSTKRVNFNQSIKYIDVVNEILSCDSRILYVDLKPIVYMKDDKSGYATEEDITGKHIITIPCNHVPTSPGDPNYDIKYDPNEGYNSALYNIDLKEIDEGKWLNTLPIKPSSVSIKVQNGTFNIYDNGNSAGTGKLISGQVEGEIPILTAAHDNFIDYGRFETNSDGTPNDKRGTLDFELRYAVATDLILSYKTSQLAIAEYDNLDPKTFYAAADCLKKKV